MAEEAPSGRFAMKTQFIRAIPLLAIGFLGCSTGFTDKDIGNLKQTVRDEFAKRPGVTVTDVTFIKESDKKLTGFVKFKISDSEVTSNCNATMGDGAQYIWKCDAAAPVAPSQVPGQSSKATPENEKIRFDTAKVRLRKEKPKTEEKIKAILGEPSNTMADFMGKGDMVQWYFETHEIGRDVIQCLISKDGSISMLTY